MNRTRIKLFEWYRPFQCNTRLLKSIQWQLVVNYTPLSAIRMIFLCWRWCCTARPIHTLIITAISLRSPIIATFVALTLLEQSLRPYVCDNPSKLSLSLTYDCHSKRQLFTSPLIDNCVWSHSPSVERLFILNVYINICTSVSCNPNQWIDRKVLQNMISQYLLIWLLFVN